MVSLARSGGRAPGVLPLNRVHFEMLLEQQTVTFPRITKGSSTDHAAALILEQRHLFLIGIHEEEVRSEKSHSPRVHTTMLVGTVVSGVLRHNC